MSQNPIQRVVIVGAGGVGGGIAGLLASVGIDVLLVARGPHLAAIQSSGLIVRTPTETRVHRLVACEHPQWKAGDVALLCVKSQDTVEALQLIPSGVPVFCAQNGVENEAIVAGSHTTGAMLVWITAVYLKPGIVDLHHGVGCPGILDLGHFSGEQNWATFVAEMLVKAGFDCVVRPDIMAWKRAKLLSNLRGISQITDGELDRELCDAMVDEGKAVLNAAKQPFTPLDTFMERMSGFQCIPIDGIKRPGGSLWQSRERGASSELGWLNGYICRTGKTLGIPTPVNSRLLAQAGRVVAVTG
ncbi:MAG: hypothetical protein JKY56_14120 [Kofleriaceae bacterium]|nr:hypothetical protein [Kofleriaceae bacterium]